MGKILFIIALLGVGYWGITQYGIKDVSDIENLVSDKEHIAMV